MNIEASITGKRQVTIPKDLYADMGLKNTDKLVFSKNENGEIVVSKKEVNNLDVCPICNREVLSEDTMVIEKSQKYHLNCWDIKKNENVSGCFEYISNKATKAQLDTFDRIKGMKKEVTLELIESLKDNEMIINVPVKLTFMENKPGVVGMIREFESNKILGCNKVY